MRYLKIDGELLDQSDLIKILNSMESINGLYIGFN